MSQTHAAMALKFPAVKFPVVVPQGEHHIKIGSIDIDPCSIDFQKLKTILEQMIGVSNDNMTIYLVDNKEHQMILATGINQNGVGLSPALLFEGCNEAKSVKDVSDDSGHLCFYDDVVEGFFGSLVRPVSRPR